MNPGAMTRRITLERRLPLKRDELGGLQEAEYEDAATVWAEQRDKTSTYRQVIGDYVTVNTCYFIIRDCTPSLPITADWRLRFEGYEYIINSIVRLNRRAPFYLELEATRIGGLS